MRISDWSSDVCSSDLRRDLVTVLLSGLGATSRNIPLPPPPCFAWSPSPRQARGGLHRIPPMLSLLPLLLQVTPVAPIIKGTALPPPDADTAAVLAPVERMFAGPAAHDAQAIRPDLRPAAGAHVATPGSASGRERVGQHS